MYKLYIYTDMEIFIHHRRGLKLQISWACWSPIWVIMTGNPNLLLLSVSSHYRNHPRFLKHFWLEGSLQMLLRCRDVYWPHVHRQLVMWHCFCFVTDGTNSDDVMNWNISTLWCWLVANAVEWNIEIYERVSNSSDSDIFFWHSNMNYSISN